jgi:acetyl esterase/lipase
MGIADGAGRVSEVHIPTLTYYPGLKDLTGGKTGTAIIVCPGGAYTHLAYEKEGAATARWLQTLGIQVFVLKYR